MSQRKVPIDLAWLRGLPRPSQLWLGCRIVWSDVTTGSGPWYPQETSHPTK